MEKYNLTKAVFGSGFMFGVVVCDDRTVEIFILTWMISHLGKLQILQITTINLIYKHN